MKYYTNDGYQNANKAQVSPGGSKLFCVVLGVYSANNKAMVSLHNIITFSQVFTVRFDENCAIVQYSVFLPSQHDFWAHFKFINGSSLYRLCRVVIGILWRCCFQNVGSIRRQIISISKFIIIRWKVWIFRSGRWHANGDAFSSTENLSGRTENRPTSFEKRVIYLFWGAFFYLAHKGSSVGIQVEKERKGNLTELKSKSGTCKA